MGTCPHAHNADAHDHWYNKVHEALVPVHAGTRRV